MNYKDFFKHNFSFQQKILSCYDQEARNFQLQHNASHREHRIWRHMLYKRTFYFFRNGIHFSVEVEIVRFRFAGTNRTFTFYGSLFCSFSHFSKEFISKAVAENTDPFSSVAGLVSTQTILHWASCLDRIPLSLTSSGYNYINLLLDNSYANP